MFKAFYSDPHIGHANIIEYCSRPFQDVDEMTNTLVTNYNRLINSDDCVLWLGDCFFKGNFARHQKLLSQMKGRKVLIVGNHDQGDGRMAAMGFELVMKEAVLNIGGITCRLNHYPYIGPSGHDKYASRRPRKNPGEILLHGHSHSFEKVTGRDSISVGVDAWDFGPALYGEVAKLVWELSKVEGAGIQKAGPYEDSEAELQLKDIAGYEGVSNVYLVEATDDAEPAMFNPIGFI